MRYIHYLGDGLTKAVVFDWEGLGETEDLVLGNVTWEGLLWLVEHAIPWPCLWVVRAGWMWVWGRTCCCEVDVFDFETVGFVNVGWGRVEGVPSASVLLPSGWLEDFLESLAYQYRNCFNTLEALFYYWKNYKVSILLNVYTLYLKGATLEVVFSGQAIFLHWSNIASSSEPLSSLFSIGMEETLESPTSFEYWSFSAMFWNKYICQSIHIF